MMGDEQMRELLRSARTIAVVGMSDKPERDSHEVGKFLMSKGYRVVPVNPSVPEVLGARSYPSLREIPPDVHVDIVDVFRKSEAVPGVVEEALSRTPLPKAVWLQLGVKDDPSRGKVEGKGIQYYQDLCIMVQHRRLFRP
ncbi:MAG: CoA-binding protein [Euryarchaeota archaeon]|nr:CoA-binding protein [Euryarchaeota archaeon]MDE1837288.1 CoA-binding protein [Euryarchaeota archaeon]MDE1879958.1 CoA-binding protein [Euryarchaeota archaeon]MDE2045107.1 CoA-binding protein [Thermoplasmata archaeon]